MKPQAMKMKIMIMKMRIQMMSLRIRMVRKWMSITAAVLFSLASSNAHALPTLQLDDLGDLNAPVTVSDSDSDGVVEFSGPIGTWSIYVWGASSFSDPDFSMGLLTENSSMGVGDLLISFTDTYFNETENSTVTTGVAGFTSGTAGFVSYLNDDIIADFGGPFGGGDFSGFETTYVSSGPFSLTIIGLFEGTHSVPEPSTLLLLGSGLIGLAGFGWRRKV